MATIVTRYESEDGQLFKSREEAELHDVAGQIKRMMGKDWDVQVMNLAPMARWIAEHGEEIASILRYPNIAKRVVDNYLGLSEPPGSPEEAE